MSENTQNLSFWNRLLTYYFEAKEAAVDRFKMPMIPYYLALIVLSYWEPLYILIFSSKPVEERTAYVRCLFQKYTLTDNLQCLGIALGFAILSSIIFPYLTIFINWVTSKSKEIDKKEQELKSKESKLNDKENILHQLEIEDIKSGKKEKEEYNKAIKSQKEQYEKTILQIEERHTREKNSLTNTIDKTAKATEEGILQMEKRFNEERKESQKNLDNLINSYEERIEQIKSSNQKQIENLENSLIEQTKMNESLRLHIKESDNLRNHITEKNNEDNKNKLLVSELINISNRVELNLFANNIKNGLFNFPRNIENFNSSNLKEIIDYFITNNLGVSTIVRNKNVMQMDINARGLYILKEALKYI